MSGKVKQVIEALLEMARVMETEEAASRDQARPPNATALTPDRAPKNTTTSNKRDKGRTLAKSVARVRGY